MGRKQEYLGASRIDFGMQDSILKSTSSKRLTFLETLLSSTIIISLCVVINLAPMLIK